MHAHACLSTCVVATNPCELRHLEFQLLVLSCRSFYRTLNAVCHTVPVHTCPSYYGEKFCRFFFYPFIFQHLWHERKKQTMNMLSSRFLGEALLLVLLLCQCQTTTSFQATRFSSLSNSQRVLSKPLYQSSFVAELPTSGVLEETAVEQVAVNRPPPLGTIMKMLPRESFDIDTKTGLFYFGVDLIAVAASLGFLNAVVTSDLYHSFPIWGQALTVAPLQVLVS